MTASTVLLVDEHAPERAFLADNLIADGYQVLIADDDAKATALLASAQPDIVVIDINGSTLGFLDRLRAGSGLARHVDPATPVIVLTSHADQVARIRLLERGADDVVSKPLAYLELRARVAAVLRRSGCGEPLRVLRAGPISIDVRARDVQLYDRPVRLAEKEYRLLVTLASEPTRVFTRAELMRGVWGRDTFGHSRTLDSHAVRLRQKLRDGGRHRLVVNVRGVGYRLIEPAVMR